MASRYPTVSVIDYCYHPVRVCDGDKDIIVPCGKCDGCLLHKANEWSMRCGMEIEDSPATIFGSLTYSNKYYPKLYPYYVRKNLEFVPYEDFKNFTQTPVSFSLDSDTDFVWMSDHSENIRFNSKEDVPRVDNLVVRNINATNFLPIAISHWDNFLRPAIGYASKRDIQLWLKLLRKFCDENISYKSKRVLERGYFRYFIISEIGPTTLRAHYHFLIFCQSVEVSQALLEGALYQNWQMCSEDRFFPYCHLCDSGARGYVTQYLTCSSDLPRVYKEAKELRPFRLASKSPAIGFIGQDKEKICQDLNRRTIKYTRPLPRLDSSSLLSYPSNFMLSLFPKCYNYGSLSDIRRESVYGYLWREVRVFGRDYLEVSRGLRESMHPSDYVASRACFKFCLEFDCQPEYYMYLHDMYHYLREMQLLRSFYESMQAVDFVKTPNLIFSYYSNLEVLCCDSRILKQKPLILIALDFALYPLGLDYRLLLGNKSFFESVRKEQFDLDELYRREVSDICDNMVKTAKHNEMTGNSPTNIFNF